MAIKSWVVNDFFYDELKVEKKKNNNNKIPLADYHLQGATTNLFKRV